jgi:hypothetical protein
MKTPEEQLDEVLGGKPEVDVQALANAARAELEKHPKPRPWWMDAAPLLILNLVMGVGASAAMTWSDLQHNSMTMRSVIAVLWLLMMSVGSVLWLRPGPAISRWLVGGGFVLASLLAVFGASGFDPNSGFFAQMNCMFIECSIALIPVSVLLILSTRFAAGPSHIFVGALAAASGGALALHLHCSNGTVSHIVLFHLLPAVLLACVAVLIRRAMHTKSFTP